MIGVVGGGIAGLSAAYRLQQQGHEVRVFEASDDLGGLAAVYETAGDPIEKFYHHLSKSEETIVELAEELGLGRDVEWRIGKNAYYVDGVVHPMDKPWEILAYPHLSLYDTFRLGMLVLDVDMRGGVPSFDSYERLEDYEDVPIEQFVVEHTTRGVYENFFEPLLDAKFGDRKDDVSAAWLLGRVKFRGERDILNGEILGYLDGGFGRLLDALVEAVGRENIETGTRVTGLDTSGREVASLTATDGEATTTHDVDSVVVATMPDVLEDLTGYACEIDFQGTVCSVISMEESLFDTYWLNIADEAPFGALIEHTNFVPAERYGGEHLLYVARYVQSPEEDIWQQDDEEVRETWLSGIEDLFPEFDRDAVNWVKTARNPRTAPVYERGYLDMVIPYDLADEVAEGVYYAGMASKAQYPERSLNGGVVAGYECADRVAQRATKRAGSAATRE
ncbi:NAD(P)/FAD-dependent oxidoreductase [Halomicroarcula limicola]|uniref:NAD(P)/FAD-dependent oxidoreductase n=1 Tax=Haloarcula limicola TaxID=1429915 RepID=A0A8J7Y5N7_9EURY|nr:NAD(P)/FAD-dependent oxidoreductase [Halomicroarcula limicola]MBV0924995.1 NAD(P)/FAD-dependent oxidoreductase [Halomicroarcula limicola]